MHFFPEYFEDYSTFHFNVCTSTQGTLVYTSIEDSLAHWSISVQIVFQSRMQRYYTNVHLLKYL